MIDPDYRGQGLSRLMIQRMAEIGRDHGLDTLIAPVRPSLKHRYPLAPMERYIEWRRDDGTLVDPWLRTHERLGAKNPEAGAPVDAHPRDGRAVGGVGRDGISGERLVRGARRAVPVEVDRERDQGLYVEPNVWMEHPPPLDR